VAKSHVRVNEEKVKFADTNCAELNKAALRCLDSVGYDRHNPKCFEAFDAYRHCKKAAGRELRNNPKRYFFQEAKELLFK